MNERQIGLLFLHFSLSLLLLLPQKTQAQPTDLHFENYTVQDGLSQHSVTTIYQDKLGYIWIGTDDGLNRFDGYQFKQYTHNPQNPRSLIDNDIEAIFEDIEGTMWVQTDKNTARYNPKTDDFDHFEQDSLVPLAEQNKHIHQILTDSKGLIWLASKKGLIRFNPRNTRKTTYQHTPANPNSLQDDWIWALFEDKSKTLWIGSFGGGLSKYNPSTNDFTHFDNTALNHYGTNRITSIAQTPDGLLWLSTYGAGLFSFDQKTEQFTHYPFDQNAANTARNKMWNILIDNQGTFWIRTEAGLDIFDIKSKTFAPQFGKNQWVQSLYQDKKGNVWALLNDQPMHNRHREVSRVNVAGTIYQSLGIDNSGHARGPLSHCAMGQQPCKNAVGAICLIQTGNNTLEQKVANCEKGGGVGAVIYNNKTAIFEADLNLSDTSINPIPLVGISNEDGNTLINTALGQMTTLDTGPINHTSPRYWYPWYFSDPTTLALFDRKSRQFTHFKGQSIYQLFEDNQQNVWAATSEGLKTYHKNDNFLTYRHNATQPHTLPHNEINTLIQDQTGIVWAGSDGGLSKMNPARQQFGFNQHNPTDKNSLTPGIVWAVYKQSNQSIWVGTSNGLNHYNPKTGAYKHYLPSDGLSHSRVTAITPDKNNNLWIGTSDGLNRLNLKTQTITSYKHNPQDPTSISNNSVREIVISNNGTLWISTNDGLNAFDVKKQRFKRYQRSSGLGGLAVSRLLIASKKTKAQQDPNPNSPETLWVGTYDGGLNRFDIKTDSFEVFQHDAKKPDSISHNQINALHQDHNGQLWVGTPAGLSQFNHQTQSFNHYGVIDGLPSNKIAAIMNDNQGNLWLGTYKGIVKFNPTAQTFKSYDFADGAFCGQISVGANHQSDDGQLFMGSPRGYCSFYPNEIKDDPFRPKVVLTDFKLFNQSTQLKTSLNHTKTITLTHKEGLFSFDFAALHYGAPKQNHYQYKLAGFDSQWITTSASNRRATYTNIPSGDYTFHVKAANKDGLWTEHSRTIKLTITPAPWRTWWAYTTYLLITCAILGAITYQRFMRFKAVVLAKENAELAKTNAEKANQAKSIFIANVSHEIRTPLNAVLGYTQMLDRDTTLEPEHKKKVGIIEKSGLHLLSLINDILDISKIEADAMQLNNIDFQLVELIDDIALMFAGRCHEKQLDWQCINQCEPSIAVHGDQGKLRQILINLLGNAVKFTAKGSVTLTLSQNLSLSQANLYRVTIKDTGIGIAPEHQQQIFKAFGQSIGGSKYGGTGLGLAIASKQITLMGGQLTLDSEQDKGSQFSFTLNLPPAQAPIELDSNQPIGSLKLAAGVSASAMVVDDVEENRDILSQILLDAGLSVYSSVNGQDALDNLHQKDQDDASTLPDLIFMDIRMPIMDGIKAMQAIQQDFKGRCPICIVITAQAMQQDVDRYLNEGFDHYIAKPFRFEDVYACIHQLLDVEFESQQTNQTPPTLAAKPATELDYTAVHIPAHLYKNILDGANDYEMTKLEQCLSELAELTPVAQQFAEVLRGYIVGYDMDGLIVELEKVEALKKTESDDA